MSKTLYSVILIILSWSMAFGQHTPPLTNFKYSDYKAHHQNWSISQSDERIMYFANTDGLLSYNGTSWVLNPLSNGKIVRSVCVVGHKIYTGAYHEIGYWESDLCSDLIYHSLNHLVPNNLIGKEEIWHIIEHKNKIYFQSFSVLLVYDGNGISQIKLPGSSMFLQVVDEKIFFHGIDSGIYTLNDDNSFEKLPNTEFFIGKVVTGITSHKANGLLITTNSSGVFIFRNGNIRPWIDNFQDYFSEVQINKSLQCKNGWQIFGTITDGLLIFDQNDSLLYHVNNSNGLQNNTILSIFEDADQNIWMGLDKGISFLHKMENALIYSDYKGNVGTIYTAAKKGKYLYLGTNQGVYAYNIAQNKNPRNPSEFSLVKGTQGQTWQLKTLETGIWCGHNDGTFVINGLQVQKISSVTGGWYANYWPSSHEKIILQGTYTGLAVFIKKGYSWQYSRKINGFNEPIKKYIIDSMNNIWLAVPNNKLYKIRLDDSLTKVTVIKPYGQKEGLCENTNVDFQQRNNDFLVKCGDHYYQYITQKDQFSMVTSPPKMENYFTLRSIDDRNYFKIYSDSLSMYSFYNNDLANFPFSLNKDYHSIAYFDENTYLLCMNEGYALIPSKTITQSFDKPNLIIDQIELENSVICFSQIKDIKIPASENHIKIHFHQTSYPFNEQIQYQVKGESSWHNVNKTPYIELTNLRYGQQEILIKAGNKAPISFPFYVLSPWYLNQFAFLTYFLTLMGFLYFLKKHFDKTLSDEKLKLEFENERILKEHKYQMENDRLIQDNLAKSKELANATMNLVQKNELLQEIKSELIDIRKTGDHTLTTQYFQNLMKIINENMTIEKDKNLFEENFNDVHDAFIKKLKAEFPDLNSADLKLAAYIKMNLASKDIAPLFNISLRGLENKRYRLRKKLLLDNEISLTEFLMKY